MAQTFQPFEVLACINTETFGFNKASSLMESGIISAILSKRVK